MECANSSRIIRLSTTSGGACQSGLATLVMPLTSLQRASQITQATYLDRLAIFLGTSSQL